MFLTCFRFLIKVVFDLRLRIACCTKSWYLQNSNKTFLPKIISCQVVSIHRRFRNFKYGQNQEMCKSLYVETFPHFQKISNYLSSLVFHTVPLCGILTMIKYWKLDKIKKSFHTFKKKSKSRNVDMFLYRDVSNFKNGQNQEMWKRLYTETFPHFQKMGKIKKFGNISIHIFKMSLYTFSKNDQIGVSIIVIIPHCPTVWNTNNDKILETGQNQEMFPHFQKIVKIKKCGYVSI